ncbi:LLM class oxidoreductase [Cellulomonas gilvus]|uniref:Luciferase-like, subgroup n=1 Tax=Cellulomonas gilvus (strain ATCC 13127 / NRRL B-14078) TaxID=593907 RepID=F8A4J1_CELGA|nr:LLM class flavin-dependent oxidoreductase [Cellulomonas gilvus]AEI13239.1 hypothetical protein Celgi_2741 [Cellulomonas gilvus ATCC 13127]
MRTSATLTHARSADHPRAERLPIERLTAGTSEPFSDEARRHVEFVLDEGSLNPTTLALAGARADVVRIRFSAALPTHPAVRALVAMLDDEVAAVGRTRDELRVVLEVETVVADDEADAARRRANLAYTAAFSHAAWSPESTWLVAPVERLAEEASALARRTGVDAVHLHLTGPSAAHVDRVTAALQRTA